MPAGVCISDIVNSIVMPVKPCQYGAPLVLSTR